MVSSSNSDSNEAVQSFQALGCELSSAVEVFLELRVGTGYVSSYDCPAFICGYQGHDIEPNE